MPRLASAVSEAERALARAVSEFDASQDSDAREFYLLKTQVLIFFYDVLLGITNIGRNNPSGFAEKVTLKSLVHNVYEYDQQLHRTILPRILKYAAGRRRPIDAAAIKLAKSKWKIEIKRTKSWKQVRNFATGHYDCDIASQVRLLKTLDRDEVMSVAIAFVHYSTSLLNLLPHKKRRGA